MDINKELIKIAKLIYSVSLRDMNKYVDDVFFRTVIDGKHVPLEVEILDENLKKLKIKLGEEENIVLMSNRGSAKKCSCGKRKCKHKDIANGVMNELSSNYGWDIGY